VAKNAGDLRTAASAASMLGVMALHDRDYPRARALFEESIAALGGEEFGTVGNLGNLAFVAFREGDLGEAAAKLRENLRLSLRLHDHVSTIHALEVLAAVLAGRGELALGAQILGASAALREEEGLSLQELEAELHEETVELVQARLGADTFADEFAEGHGALLAELIGLAIARLE
jgi:hypothetical protein